MISNLVKNTYKKLIPVKSRLLMASEYVLKITYFLRIHIWNRTLFQTYHLPSAANLTVTVLKHFDRIFIFQRKKTTCKTEHSKYNTLFYLQFLQQNFGWHKMAKEIQVFFHMYTITSDHRLGSRRTCTNSIILPSFILSLGTMLRDFVDKLYAKCIILVSKSVAKCFNVIFSNLSHSKMLCNVKCALLFTTKVYIRVT